MIARGVPARFSNSIDAHTPELNLPPELVLQGVSKFPHDFKALVLHQYSIFFNATFVEANFVYLVG